MSHFILLQYPYEHIEVALATNDRIIDTINITKFQAVALLIPTLQTILEKNNLTKNDIAALGINVGPGPFNTLRSLIATANGISFVTKIPLIACNSLTMMLSHQPQSTIALLNAFGTDVYYAFHEKQGYQSITTLITSLNTSHNNQTITFIGNGAQKHRDYIQQNFIGIAKFKKNILFSTLEDLHIQTMQLFKEQETQLQVKPLYLQSPAIKNNLQTK